MSLEAMFPELTRMMDKDLYENNPDWDKGIEELKQLRIERCRMKMLMDQMGRDYLKTRDESIKTSYYELKPVLTELEEFVKKVRYSTFGHLCGNELAYQESF